MSLIININLRVYMKREPVTNFYNPFFKYQPELWVCGTTLTPTTDMIYKLLRVFGVQREPMVQVKFSSRPNLHIMPWVKWLENTNLTKSCNNSLRSLSCLHTVKLLNFIFMTYVCKKTVLPLVKKYCFTSVSLHSCLFELEKHFSILTTLFEVIVPQPSSRLIWFSLLNE